MMATAGDVVGIGFAVVVAFLLFAYTVVVILLPFAVISISKWTKCTAEKIEDMHTGIGKRLDGLRSSIRELVAIERELARTEGRLPPVDPPVKDPPGPVKFEAFEHLEGQK